MADLTKQEMQGVIENAKNRIIECAASRNDVQKQCNLITGRIMQYLQYMHHHNQQMAKHSQNELANIIQHVSALESRLSDMEQAVKTLDMNFERLNREPSGSNNNRPGVNISGSNQLTQPEQEYSPPQVRTYGYYPT